MSGIALTMLITDFSGLTTCGLTEQGKGNEQSTVYSTNFNFTCIITLAVFDV